MREIQKLCSRLDGLCTCIYVSYPTLQVSLNLHATSSGSSAVSHNSTPEPFLGSALTQATDIPHDVLGSSCCSTLPYPPRQVPRHVHAIGQCLPPPLIDHRWSTLWRRKAAKARGKNSHVLEPRQIYGNRCQKGCTMDLRRRAEKGRLRSDGTGVLCPSANPVISSSPTLD